MVIDPRNGALLPPKLVLTTAAKIANDERRHRVFSGGRDTNKRLEDLGFSVVERPADRDGEFATSRSAIRA
jgi:hypothetical protein